VNLHRFLKRGGSLLSEYGVVQNIKVWAVVAAPQQYWRRS
jgi:hypothetical protein